jgi:hypothetical protein
MMEKEERIRNLEDRTEEGRTGGVLTVERWDISQENATLSAVSRCLVQTILGEDQEVDQMSADISEADAVTVIEVDQSPRERKVLQC